MKRLVVGVAAAAALALPAHALAGTVLKVDLHAHSVAVVGAKGHVKVMRSASVARLHVGQRVVQSGSSFRVVGHASKLRFSGILTHRRNDQIQVSAGGTTVNVNGSGPAPAVGSEVSVTASVGNDDQLSEVDVQTVLAATPGGKIDGLLALGPAGFVTVASDVTILRLAVPTGFSLTGFASGDQVTATFTQGADGSLVLTKLEPADNTGDESDGSNGDDNGDSSNGNSSSGSNGDNGNGTTVCGCPGGGTTGVVGIGNTDDSNDNGGQQQGDQNQGND